MSSAKWPLFCLSLDVLICETQEMGSNFKSITFKNISVIDILGISHTNMCEIPGFTVEFLFNSKLLYFLQCPNGTWHNGDGSCTWS